MPAYDYFALNNRIASIEWRLPSNVIRLESPFTKQQQVIPRLGERWECTITFPPQRTDDYFFFLSIGTNLWVRDDLVNPDATEWMIPYYGYSGPKGSAGASNNLTATGSAGSMLVTLSGFTTEPDPVFRGGDAIQIGEHLYLVGAAFVNRSGQSSAAVPVWPRLRANYSGAVISFDNPRVKMRRVSPLTWNVRPGNIATIDPIDFVEVFP